MTAEIVSVGTELLLGQIVDTDAAHLAAILPEYGIACTNRQTVGDNLARLTEALKLALSRADIVFTIGGLGPTEDDLTRGGIAAALGEELVMDDQIAEKLRKLFALRNIPWVDSQLRQAMRPDCGRPIENPNGTAPGLICEKGVKTVVAMPGPRGEFVPMAEGPVRELLSKLGSGRVIHSRILKVVGLGESIVEDRIRALLASENPTVAPYAHPGEVHLRLTSRAASKEAAVALIQPVEDQIRAILGQALFGADGDTIESAVLELIRSRGQTLAVAESCTGGGLGARFTSVPGSSDVFLGGVISYANSAKSALLGVPESILAEFGAVSRECAEAMALGACVALGADWGVSITGVAGPDGGTPQKPVGLVYVGVARVPATGRHLEGGATISGPLISVQEHKFRGTREFVRLRSVQAALTELRAIVLAA